MIYYRPFGRSWDEIHPIKQAVWRVVKELSPQGAGKEDPDNPGVFNLSLRPIDLQSKVLNSNRLFSTKLNPKTEPSVRRAQSRP
ncbi:hypothetical protein [Legionella sp. WA2022007384]